MQAMAPNITNYRLETVRTSAIMGLAASSLGRYQIPRGRARGGTSHLAVVESHPERSLEVYRGCVDTNLTQASISA